MYSQNVFFCNSVASVKVLTCEIRIHLFLHTHTYTHITYVRAYICMQVGFINIARFRPCQRLFPINITKFSLQIVTQSTYVIL